ncbi:putative purine permease, plant [Lupinus albus]|uniref:Probable purine permease n=1 Tax=Lupinus albus TaxID=3870 RepID=A0A6A4PRV0_LUPAL|nr:putative purine permease, plant [Lupinus albus]
MKRILLLINCIILGIGTSGSPLIMRLYFIHGGSRIWLSSFLQTIGFPVLLLPLFIFYIHNRHTNTDNEKPKIVSIEPPLFVAAAIIGVLTGVGCFLYSYAAARLPVSTSSLIASTQLAFCAVFAFFLVKQKFTAFSVNSVVLLIVAAGVLALSSGGDRPVGESTKQYAMGFVMMSIAAALNGSVLPLTELVYKKTKHAITYSLILEIQFVACFFATLFSMTGMIVNNDFKVSSSFFVLISLTFRYKISGSVQGFHLVGFKDNRCSVLYCGCGNGCDYRDCGHCSHHDAEGGCCGVISREAQQFGLGEIKYYVVLVASAIISQVYFLGVVGVIFSASSLLSGVMISMLLPVTEVLAVIFYKESFHAEKGVSLFLSLWGFVSYFYGEFKQAKEMKKVTITETELPQHHCDNPNP